MARGEEDEALASRLPVLRAALEQQRRFRREQLALLEANGRAHESSADTDPSDHRDEERTHALREVDALVVAGARRALADIELALVRMHTGRYGLCRSCAARIPVCVLEAIPKTTLCLACQHRSEHTSDQRTGARSRKRAPRRRQVASAAGDEARMMRGAQHAAYPKWAQTRGRSAGSESPSPSGRPRSWPLTARAAPVVRERRAGRCRIGLPARPRRCPANCRLAAQLGQADRLRHLCAHPQRRDGGHRGGTGTGVFVTVARRRSAC
jgi:DnaK suppressor protein